MTLIWDIPGFVHQWPNCKLHNLTPVNDKCQSPHTWLYFGSLQLLFLQLWESGSRPYHKSIHKSDQNKTSRAQSKTRKTNESGVSVQKETRKWQTHVSQLVTKIWFIDEATELSDLPLTSLYWSLTWHVNLNKGLLLILICLYVLKVWAYSIFLVTKRNKGRKSFKPLVHLFIVLLLLNYQYLVLA